MIAIISTSKTIAGEPLDPNRSYWIYFDRRDNSDRARIEVLNSLDDKAVERRIRATGQAVLDGDLPPHPDDLTMLREAGCRIRTVSKWMNAVSVELPTSTRVSLGDLPHVRKIQAVNRGKNIEPSQPRESKEQHTLLDQEDYGVAWNQNNLIGIPELHEQGYTGEGVRLGLLDSGYSRFDSHVAFEHLNVIATWNALDSTENVSTASHGAAVLSIIAAKDSGNFLGIAPDCEFLLVRTEDSSDEYPLEEDYWVSGLEWVEAAGADLVSTSLGYSAWYDSLDYDGNTAVTTIAADLAAARGLLVVTSAGNRGTSGVSAPGDGDSVLTIGATDSLGQYVGFSSVGPTADGRIKPDVAALGYLAYGISDTSDSTYRRGNGTSFSCPAVAGGIALLLQENPDLLPMQIISIMHRTASQANHPDNQLGWGIADFPAAMEAVSQGVIEPRIIPTRFKLLSLYPNPMNSMLQVSFSLSKTATLSFTIHNLLGQQLWQFSKLYPSGTQSTTLSLDEFSSSTYLLTLSDETNTVTRRFVLLK
ncbi:S8 family peptidase [bacterium]|nr:S8 family peptidase [bacterium]